MANITVRRIGGGYYIASVSLKNSIRSGLAQTREEAIARVNRPNLKSRDETVTGENNG